MLDIDTARYGNRAFVCALIGMLFGITHHYPVRLLISVLTSPSSDTMGHLVSVSVGVTFTAFAAAVAGAATAGLSSLTSRSVRKCAVIGGGFGLVVGIANAAVAMAVPGVGIEPTTDAAVVLALVSAVVALLVVSKIVVDAVLAIIVFRFVRSRRSVRSSATDT